MAAPQLSLVSTLQQASLRNQLLSRIAPEDFDGLQPHLEPVKLALRQHLFEANTPIEFAYFFESGISSTTTTSRSSQVEISIAGREGMVGVPIVLGTDRSPFQCFMQAEGHGLRIASYQLDRVLRERSGLHRFLLRYVQAMSVQTSSTAFVNAEHNLETRLARWLLMCHDRTDGDDLALTHEFLSMMLGVRRPGVTTAIHVLEGNHLIRASRGLITVRNREGLETLADNAYGMPEAEYARLMAEG
jgi:CRP-like cAMP-binding protein